MICETFKYFTSFSWLHRFANTSRILKQAFWALEIWNISFRFIYCNGSLEHWVFCKLYELWNIPNGYINKINLRKVKFLNKLSELQESWTNSIFFIDWFESSAFWIFVSKLFDIFQFKSEAGPVCEKSEFFKKTIWALEFWSWPIHVIVWIGLWKLEFFKQAYWAMKFWS